MFLPLLQVTIPYDSTYYMSNGFHCGYMGIQQKDPKTVLFSTHFVHMSALGNTIVPVSFCSYICSRESVRADVVIDSGHAHDKLAH